MNESPESFIQNITPEQNENIQEPDSQKWWQYRLSELNDVSREQIEYARHFFEFASGEDTRLRAMTIVGSTLKGYAREGSDIDVSLFLKEDKHGNTALEHCEHLIRRFADGQVRKFDINPNINVDVADISSVDKKPKVAAALLRPGFGGIESLRDEARKSVASLAGEGRSKWVETVVRELVKHDSHMKMMDRGKLKTEDVDKFKQAREKLFREKVKRMFFFK